MTLKRKILRVSKGQISPDLIERTDIGILDASGQKILNYYNSKYGALKSAPGTRLVIAWNGIKKCKMQKIKLADLTEGFIVFNGTDKTISVYNNQAELISNVLTAAWLNTTNINNLILAQNQDLILVATGDNPIYQINIDNLNAITASVFSISMSNILKSASITIPALDPLVFRMGNSGLPVDPSSIGMTVGDLAYANSGTANPGTTFPWALKRLDQIASLSRWNITGATINDPGTDYVDGDIVEAANGAQFEYNNGALTILDLTAIYETNPAGSDLPVMGGSGTGMTIDITSATISTIWTDVSYTPTTDDVIRDTWNSVVWVWTGSAWAKPTANSDQTYGTQWYNSAVSGVVKITAKDNGTLFSLTAPTGTDPTAYAQGILYGMTFDGLNAIGMLQIQSITGSVSGQTYNVKTIDGQTLVSFDKNYTNSDPATSFVIKYSEQPVFSGDRPFTSANPTEQTNYPTSILFYQQRLIIGGTSYNPSQMIFSELGKYNTFKDEFYSSSAFQLIIGSTEKEQIKRILLNQGIQIFTTNNEWLMGDQIITRNSGFIRNSSIGTSGVEPVIAANGTTLFVPKNGKGLIGFTYNFQTASYSTPYISLFTDLLDTGIVDICQKRGLDSTDDTLLYISMVDGSLVIGNYLQEHEIQAFCKRSNPNATYKQTIQCDDQVIHLVDRNGNTGLELIDETKYTEASPYSFTYTRSSGKISLSTPISYNGQTLNVYDGNHKFIGEYEVVNGVITLPSDNRPLAVEEVGYNISSEFISNPQNINAQTKTIYKSITAIRLALTTDSNPDYLKVENKSASWVKDNLAEYRRLIRPTRDARFHITNDRYPVEILSIEIEIEA